jgi:hypothetical protein
MHEHPPELNDKLIALSMNGDAAMRLCIESLVQAA